MATVKIEWQPNSWQQQEFVLNEEAKHCALMGGYGAGKTFPLTLKSLMYSVKYPEHLHLFIEPDYPRVIDLAVPEMEAHLERAGLQYKYNRSEKMLTHELSQGKGGIKFLSAETPEKIIGYNAKSVSIDEAGLIDEKVFEKVMARLRGKEGEFRQFNYAGTWEGRRGWMYQNIYEKKIKDAALYIIKTTANVKNVGSDYIENLRLIYSDTMIQQYVDGIPCDIGQGRVYYSFDIDRHVKQSKYMLYDRSLPLGIAKDFNVGKMMTLFIQFHREKGIRVIDEICLHNSNTPEMDAAIIAKLRQYKFSGDLYIYGDSSGNSRQTNSMQSDWRMTGDTLRGAGFSTITKVQSSNPQVRLRYNTVNQHISGKTRIDFSISEKCKETIKDLRDVVYEKDSDVINKIRLERQGLTHASDALGYFYCMEFPLFTGNYS